MHLFIPIKYNILVTLFELSHLMLWQTDNEVITLIIHFYR
jgi:hypothetical protein